MNSMNKNLKSSSCHCRSRLSDLVKGCTESFCQIGSVRVKHGEKKKLGKAEMDRLHSALNVSMFSTPICFAGF